MPSPAASTSSSTTCASARRLAETHGERRITVRVPVVRRKTPIQRPHPVPAAGRDTEGPPEGTGEVGTLRETGLERDPGARPFGEGPHQTAGVFQPTAANE